VKLRGTPESVPEAIAVVLNLISIMSWGSSAKRTRKTESLRSAKAIGIYVQRELLCRSPILRPRKPVLIVSAACILALAGAIASYKALFGNAAGAAGTASAAAQERPKPPNSVAALGRLEPRSELINVGAGTGPDRLESLFVERGDGFKKGDVLGYLGGYAEQMAQRDVLLAQLDEAKARQKAETDVARARLRQAEANRRRVLDVWPHRIAEQEATIAGLDAKHEKDIQAAREHLAELKAQSEGEKADAAVQLDIAQASLDQVAKQFPTASLESQISAAEIRAKRLTLHGPCDCRVLNIRLKPGEEVGTGPILVVGDTERMRAVAEVYETDIGKVRVGQLAEVTSRALPKPVKGRVARIGNTVFKNDVLNVDPAARADARVVQVWIDLDLDDQALAKQLTNLTVDVLITTSQSSS
jgi:HlyD family secretion protein